MEWSAAVLRAPPGHGVVAGYTRLLRLLSGLKSGAGFGFLAAHVNATTNVPRVRELSSDPLVELFRRRLREVGDVDRDLLRYLVLTDGQADGRRDMSILESLWRSDPIRDPIGCLTDVIETERGFSEIRPEGLEMPQLPRREAICAEAPPLTNDQLRDVLFGQGYSSGCVAPRVGRWEKQDTPLSSSGVPLWCIDLLPPRAETIDYAADERWAPLAVLYGEVQEVPTYFCPVAHVTRVQQAVQRSVLRFLPSGCATWEYGGLEYAMPATPEVFVPSASMVSNCVVRTEIPVIGGQVDF